VREHTLGIGDLGAYLDREPEVAAKRPLDVARSRHLAPRDLDRRRRPQASEEALLRPADGEHRAVPLDERAGER
jgi:hypothetical protein